MRFLDILDASRACSHGFVFSSRSQSLLATGTVAVVNPASFFFLRQSACLRVVDALQIYATSPPEKSRKGLRIIGKALKTIPLLRIAIRDEKSTLGICFRGVLPVAHFPSSCSQGIRTASTASSLTLNAASARLPFATAQIPTFPSSRFICRAAIGKPVSDYPHMPVLVDSRKWLVGIQFPK